MNTYLKEKIKENAFKLGEVSRMIDLRAFQSQGVDSRLVKNDSDEMNHRQLMQSWAAQRSEYMRNFNEGNGRGGGSIWDVAGGAFQL